MRIKFGKHKRPTGILGAALSVAPGFAPGIVGLMVQELSLPDYPVDHAHVRLSVAEARSLANALNRVAALVEKAQRLPEVG